MQQSIQGGAVHPGSVYQPHRSVQAHFRHTSSKDIQDSGIGNRRKIPQTHPDGDQLSKHKG